jgi:hypothetical protein
MGGYGSTRWNSHYKRMAVEDCHKLPMRIIHSFMLKGRRWGSVTWSRGGEPIGNISYRVIGGEEPESLRLIYTITKHDSGEKKDLDYPVRLTTTPLPWGGQRYWFICPAVGCGRRVNVLYLAPGGEYFACRHCYRLSYRSRQDGYSDRVLYKSMANMMQDLHPGITWRMMKEVLKDR